MQLQRHVSRSSGQSLPHQDARRQHQQSQNIASQQDLPSQQHQGTSQKEPSENIDAEAIDLAAMDCEFFVDNEAIKKLEVEYFSKLEFQDSLMFGGTMGKSPGGITEIATTANQKLFVAAIDNGTILVYDTEYW